MKIELNNSFKKDLGDINKKLKINPKNKEGYLMSSIWDDENKILHLTIDFKGQDITSIEKIKVIYEVLYSNEKDTKEAFSLIVEEKDYLSPQKNIFKIIFKDEESNKLNILADIKSNNLGDDIEFLEKTSLDIGYSIFLLENTCDNKLVTKDSFDKYLYKEFNKDTKKNQFGKNYINQVGEEINRDITYREYLGDKFFPKFIGNIETSDDIIYISNEGGTIKLSGVIGYSELDVVNNKIIAKHVGYQDLRELKCSLITDLNNYSPEDPTLEIKNNRVVIPGTNEDFDWKFKIKVSASFVNYDNSILNCSKEFTIIRTKNTLIGDPWILELSNETGELASSFYEEKDYSNIKKVPVIVFKNILDDNNIFLPDQDNNANLRLKVSTSDISEAISKGGLKITHTYLTGYSLDFIEAEDLFNVFYKIDLDNIKTEGINFIIPIKRWPLGVNAEDEYTSIYSNLGKIKIDGYSVSAIDQNSWYPQITTEKIVNEETIISNHTSIIKTTISCDLGEENGGVFETDIFIMNEPIVVSGINSKLKIGGPKVENLEDTSSYTLIPYNNNNTKGYIGTANNPNRCYLGWKEDNDFNIINLSYVLQKGKPINLEKNSEFLISTSYTENNQTVSCWAYELGSIHLNYGEYLVNDINLNYPEYYKFPDSTSITVGILNNQVFGLGSSEEDKSLLQKYPEKLGDKFYDWKTQILIPKKIINFDIEQRDPVIWFGNTEATIDNNIATIEHDYIDLNYPELKISSVYPIEIKALNNYSTIPTSNSVISGNNTYKYQLDVYNNSKDSSDANGYYTKCNSFAELNYPIKNNFENTSEQNNIQIGVKVNYYNDNAYNPKTAYLKDTNSFENDLLIQIDDNNDIKKISLINFKNGLILNKGDNKIELDYREDNKYSLYFNSNFKLGTGTETEYKVSNNGSNVKFERKLIVDNINKEDIITNLDIFANILKENTPYNYFDSDNDSSGLKIGTVSIYFYEKNNRNITINLFSGIIPPVLRDNLGNLLPEKADILLMSKENKIGDKTLGSDIFEKILFPYNIDKYTSLTANTDNIINKDSIKYELSSDISDNEHEIFGYIKYTLKPNISTKQGKDQISLKGLLGNIDKVTFQNTEYNRISKKLLDYITYESTVNMHFITDLSQEFFSYEDSIYYSGDTINIENQKIDYIENEGLRLRTPIIYKKCNRTYTNEIETSNENVTVSIENYPDTIYDILNSGRGKNYSALTTLQDKLIGVSNVPIIIDLKIDEIKDGFFTSRDKISNYCWRTFNLTFNSDLRDGEENIGISNKKELTLSWKGITKYLEVKKINDVTEDILYYALDSEKTFNKEIKIDGKSTSVILNIQPLEVVNKNRDIEVRNLSESLYIELPENNNKYGFNIDDENYLLVLQFPENKSTEETQVQKSTFIIKYENIIYNLTITQNTVDPWELYLNNDSSNDDLKLVDEIDSNEIKTIPIHSTGYGYYIIKSTEENPKDKYLQFGFIKLKSNHNIINENKILISGYYYNNNEKVYYSDTAISAVIKTIEEVRKNDVLDHYEYTINLLLPPNIGSNIRNGVLEFHWGEITKYIKFSQGYICPKLILNDNHYFLSDAIKNNEIWVGIEGNVGTKSNPINTDLSKDIESTIQVDQREVKLDGNTYDTLQDTISIVSYTNEPSDNRYSVVSYYNDPWTVWLKESPASYIVKSGNNTDILYENNSDYPKLVHSCDIDPLYKDKGFCININTILSLNRIRKYTNIIESTDDLNNYITTSSINSIINSPFKFSFWLQNKTND